MAQLLEDEDFLLQAHNGTELAQLSTFAAAAALLWINFRHADGDLLSLLYVGLQEDVPVRLFHIAVKILDFLAQVRKRTGKVRSDSRLTGSALSTGDGYPHVRQASSAALDFSQSNRSFLIHPCGGNESKGTGLGLHHRLPGIICH
jgi:hypothetical protein